MTIDEEIEQHKQTLLSRESTHPDYLPPEILELQNRVIITHARLGISMGNVVLLKLKETLAPLDEEKWKQVLFVVAPLLDNTSYMGRLRTLEMYDDSPAGLLEALKKVNSYRIEFAHPEGMELRKKYNHSDSKAKQRIRDLLRGLVDTDKKMDDYMVQIRPTLAKGAITL